MADMRPILTSAARLLPIVKIGTQTLVLGHAVGLQFRVSKVLQPTYGFGSYAPTSISVLKYNGVKGQIQFTKLSSSSAVTAYTAALTSNIAGLGNAPVAVKSKKDANNGLMTVEAVARQFDPVQILLSGTFDLVIMIRHAALQDAAIMKEEELSKQVKAAPDSQAIAVDAMKSTTTQELGLPLIKTVEYLIIKDCRLDTRGVNINEGQLLGESFGFTGRMVLPSFGESAALPAADITKDYWSDERAV